LEAKDADTVSIEDLVVAQLLLSRYEILRTAIHSLVYATLGDKR
jgi:hypothetical protein